MEGPIGVAARGVLLPGAAAAPTVPGAAPSAANRVMSAELAEFHLTSAGGRVVGSGEVGPGLRLLTPAVGGDTPEPGKHPRTCRPDIGRC